MRIKVIPPGIHLLRNENAHRLQEEVMTGAYGDNPHLAMFTHRMPYETGWDFEGEEDLEIDATGATLLVDGFMTAVALQHCRNITVKGLTIDLRRRAYSTGEVVKVGDGFFDIRFQPDEWLSEKMPAPRILFTDPETGRISGVINAEVESKAVKECVGENTFRFFYTLSPSLLGHRAGVMHTWHSCPSILIYEADNVTLKDVTILSHPGMGIVGHRARNVRLEGVRIVPAEGMNVSTNTDATHFISCSGELVYEGCEFEGCGDDGANVHSFYQTILSQTGTNTCETAVLVRTDIHSLRQEYPLPGDTLEYARKDDLIPLGKYRVLSSVPDPVSRRCTVTLDRPLPDDCVGCVLTPVNRIPALRFSGCTVRNNIARGILCRTCNADIESNHFEGCTLEGIAVAAEVSWNESGRSENVLIRDNTCVRCGITVSAEAPALTAPIHRNIRLENNRIEGNVSIGYVTGLTLENNKIAGSLSIDKCENIMSKRELKRNTQQNCS